MRVAASGEMEAIVTCMMKSRQPDEPPQGRFKGVPVSLTTYSWNVPDIVAELHARTPVSATMVPLGGRNVSGAVLAPGRRRPALAEPASANVARISATAAAIGRFSISVLPRGTLMAYLPEPHRRLQS